MSDQGAGDQVPPGNDDSAGRAPSNTRWWWFIAVLIAVIVILLLVLLLGGGDGDDDGSDTTTSTEVEPDETTTTTTEAETTTSSSPATTSTTAGTTDVTADPAQCADAGSDPTNPEPAAQAVFIAWTRGDTACAEELMSDDALAALFARDGTDATDVFQGCFEQDEPDPHMDCAFTYEGGSTHYRMDFSPTDGWQVDEVYQVAD